MPVYPCRVGTCSALLKTRGYCDKHQHLAPPVQKHYSQYSRDPESVAFYRSTQWKNTRNTKLNNNPICEHCKRELAAQVHHIRPVKQIRITEPHLLHDASNLLSLCASCHSRIEKRWGHSE
jgi:5-methylcytosine-specific restriction protein A